MTLSQRQPRIEDPAYLAYVRSLPCKVCGRPGPSDPAHLRSPALQYDKKHTGMQEKPSDCWVLPLCRTHHEDQHRNNELAWWTRYGITDPFAVAMALYAARPVQTHSRRAPKFDRPKLSKSKTERKLIHSRKTAWPSRPMRSRPFSSRKDSA